MTLPEGQPASLPAGVPVSALRPSLMAELRIERDKARDMLGRARWQRDACLMVIAGLLFGIVLWRWF